MVDLIQRAAREARIARAEIYLRSKRVAVGRRPLAKGWLPFVQNEGSMAIGDGAVIYGEEARVLIRTGPGARLVVGRRALINSGAQILAARSITIGDDVKIGNYVAISDTGSHEVRPGDGIKTAPVVIGNNVWIGRSAFVMPGVTIGEGAVVGAGSIVTKDVAPYSVVVGTPARLVRTLDPFDRVRR